MLTKYTVNLAYLSRILGVFILLFLWLGHSSLAWAVPKPEPPLELTEAEQAYLKQHSKINLIVMDGVAPIMSITEDGDFSGITKVVTEHISKMLGVEFICVPVRTVEEFRQAVEREAGEAMLIPANYAVQLPSESHLTKPFLTADTVLFYRNDLKLNELEDRICAAVPGSSVPEWVKEENILSSSSRLDSIQKVHEGEADYGYGNEFSIAYYVALYNYTNISTLPTHQDIREYCYGVLNGEPLLLSILNKAVEQIDANEMQTIIMSACVLPEVPPTFSELIVQFAVPFTIIIGLLLLGLVIIVIYIKRNNRKLKLQNIRLETIAEVSGDLMFEYDLKAEELLLSKQFREVFRIPKQSKPYDKSVIQDLVNIEEVIKRKITGEELDLGGTKFFRAFYSYVEGKGSTPVYLVGKLIDITVDKAEIQDLANKAQIDGLTKVLNATEAKLRAEEYLATLPIGQKDALIILDLDRFKHINDNYGHYAGDQVLIKTATVLKIYFKSQDLVGRLGGDEFLVYLRNVQDIASLPAKCQKLEELLRFPLEKDGKQEKTSISMGVYLISQPEPFKEVYQKADQALYTAKSQKEIRYWII